MTSSNQLKNTDPDPIFVLRSGSDNITWLQFCCFGSNNEEVLLSGNQNGLILIWDLKIRRVVKQLQVSERHGILYADILQIDGEQFLISHDREGLVKLFKVTNLEEEFVLQKSWKVYAIGFCAIQICEDDRNVWLGYPSADSQVSVISITKNSENKKYDLKPEGKLGMVMQIRMFIKDSKLYSICGYEDGSVIIWDVINANVVDRKPLYQNPVMCLDVHIDTMKLVTGSSDDIIYQVNLNDVLHFTDIKKHVSKSTGFSSVALRKDGKIVSFGGWDGKVRIFSWKSLKPLAILKYHTEAIGAVSFSEKNILACGCKDGKISLWDVYQNT